MVLGEVGGVGGGVWGPGVLAGVLGPLAQGSLMQYKGIWGPGTPGPGVPGPLGPVKTVESRGPGVLGPLPGVLGPSQAILGPPEPLLASTGQYWPVLAQNPFGAGIKSAQS